MPVASGSTHCIDPLTSVGKRNNLLKDSSTSFYTIQANEHNFFCSVCEQWIHLYTNSRNASSDFRHSYCIEYKPRFQRLHWPSHIILYTCMHKCQNCLYTIIHLTIWEKNSSKSKAVTCKKRVQLILRSAVYTEYNISSLHAAHEALAATCSKTTL